MPDTPFTITWGKGTWHQRDRQSFREGKREATFLKTVSLLGLVKRLVSGVPVRERAVASCGWTCCFHPESSPHHSFDSLVNTEAGNGPREMELKY